ncbi:GNAT family protein [Streptomyces caniscabiei]|uniref:GNAT family N-acetyltransferase n=1 Tax=Streptomyces caniscabiei TaxID=2746961 RepID=UPI0029B48B0C|nr:GNAT family protein [Streptomyces caniscabiei]MDX2776525.1 GNAT family protein [Streptomyces caniscabiei]
MNVGDMAIELAPVTKESVRALVSPGMQQASVTRYLFETIKAMTLEDEQDWYDKTRTEKNTMVWGIWHDKGAQRSLIGTTSLTDITRLHIYQATSGSMLSNTAYWNKGIASTIHRARTWYAFEHMGLVRIKSAVMHGNVASKRALEKVGYTDVFVERNTAFINGKLRHQDNLECLSPLDAAWNTWWGDEMPTEEALKARKRTQEALDWARENVVLL